MFRLLNECKESPIARFPDCSGVQFAAVATAGGSPLIYNKGNSMRFTGFVTAAAFVLATSVGMYAQAKPDFSGKWVMDPASAPAPAAPPAGAPAGGGGRG